MAFFVPGSCLITYDGKALGTAKTGVLIKSNAVWLPIQNDEFGNAPAGYLHGGKQVTVELIINEFVVDVRGIGLIAEDMFPDGLLGCLTGVATSNLALGGLASTIAKILTITESISAAPAHVWTATYAVLDDPEQLLLMSTQEQALALRFFLLHDNAQDDDIWDTAPPYFA